MATKKTTTRANVRCAVYTRISRDKEGLALGVERQRTDCLRLAEGNGWTIVHDGEHDTFSDNDISGAKDFTKRVAFGRLLKAIEAGKVDAVVAYSQARIYRDTKLFLEFCGRLKAAGVETIALVTDADVNPGGSLFLATVIAAKDEEERRRVSELVQRKMLEKAEAGEPSGGSRPFGYGRTPKNDSPEEKAAARATINEINKAEAALIRKAAQRILEGHSLRSVTMDWNERGIRSTRGNVFFDTQVKKILTSPRVAGLRQHQGKVIGKAVWPAILDEATWTGVCTRLNDPSRRMPRASKNYPLRGIVTCALCGQFLQAKPRAAGRRYGCRKEGGIGCGGVSINADIVERYVFSLILPILDSPDLRDAIRAKDEEGAEAAREIVLAKAADEKKLRQYSDDYADGVCERQEYLRQSQRLRKRIDDYEAQLASQHGRSALSSLGGKVQSGWNKMSADDKRAILKSVIERIEVAKAPNLGSHNFDPDRLQFKFVDELTGTRSNRAKVAFAVLADAIRNANNPPTPRFIKIPAKDPLKTP